MLGRLKSLFAPPAKPTSIDVAFHARFEKSFRLGPVPLEGGAITFGATGSASWLNPRSENDRKVLMGSPTHVLETDSPHILADISSDRYAPHHQFVLYQPWREPQGRSELRLLGALTEAMTPAIGTALQGSPVEHFFLITGGVSPGALTALKNSLDGHRLETFGLFWYYSGDDMTDDPGVVDELTALCRDCQVEKLSLLTAAVDSVVETRLVKGLSDSPWLRECSVFEKDDHARYPRFRTPTLDALLQERLPQQPLGAH